MKIEQNDSINAFIKELAVSIVDNNKLKTMIANMSERVISYKEEEELLKEYRKYGINLQTLKYDVSELLNNPYYKNIKLNNVKLKDIGYVNKVLQSRKCLTMSYVKYTGRLLECYCDLGYFNKAVNIPILTENDNVWMSSTISEHRSMEEHVNKANGNVLTFGLGIGYYPYMCLLKDNVESITIIEVNQDIIDMFNKYILPQFKTDKKVEIIKGDMYDYYNREFMSNFNYIFVDTWDSNEDGLVHYKKLMKTGIREANIGYWIEDSIIENTKMLMAIYLKAIATNTFVEVLNKFDGINYEDLKRIHKYFRGIDKTVTDPQDILNYIHDIDTIRNILSLD